MDETQLGKLAVWSIVRRDRDAVQLLIDLDHDVALTVSIGPDGRTTAELTGAMAAWLTPEDRTAA